MERLKNIPKRVRERARTTALGMRFTKEAILIVVHKKDSRGQIVHIANLLDLVVKEDGIDKRELLESPAIRRLGESLLEELRNRWKIEQERI